jgi:cytoskeletal protein CcmA (bactofilin family)
VLVGNANAGARGAAQLAGVDVVFAGNSSSAATIYGDSAPIDGQIAEDVTLRAGNVRVGRAAVIDGAVRFETLGEPRIEEGATLRGRQTVTLQTIATASPVRSPMRFRWWHRGSRRDAGLGRGN